MRIRKLNHSVYQVKYHIVWGTKYRRKILKHYVRKEKIVAIYRVLRKHPTWYIERINSGDDYVHLMMEISPKERIADVVRELKKASSHELQRRFPFIAKIYEKGNMWSVGCFVSTVGLDEEQIRKYIEKQNEWDRGYDVSEGLS